MNFIHDVVVVADSWW